MKENDIKKHPIYVEAICIATAKLWKIVKAVVLLICLFIFLLIVLDDGAYDRCMKECVKEDRSNYDECTFDTCDFPI